MHLVVHRLQNAVYFKRVTSEAFRLLMNLHEGMTLEAACGRAFKGRPFTPDQAAALIREWFADWMELGWFARSL